MKTFVRRFPGPAIAAVALIFSATVVLASQPGGVRPAGLANAANDASQSGEPDESAEPTDAPESSEAPDASDAPDASGSPCTVDLTQDPSVLAGLNHGSVVCTAAQMPTPSGYANHGAWVSHWAKMNHGHNHSPNSHSGQ